MKNEGSITIIKGAMGSGKTHALDAIYKKNPDNCLFIDCTPGMVFEDILLRIKNNPEKDIVLIDEFQFCDVLYQTDGMWINRVFQDIGSPNFVKFVIKNKKKVFFASLEFDWRNTCYESLAILLDSLKLIHMSVMRGTRGIIGASKFKFTQITKYSVCAKCGQPAQYNNRLHKIDNNAPVLLDKDAYLSLCNTCSEEYLQNG